MMATCGPRLFGLLILIACLAAGAYDFRPLRNPVLKRLLDSVFSPASGHDHDGANSKAVADGAITDAKMASDTKVGSLAALATSVKTSVVAAINEVEGRADTNAADVAEALARVATNQAASTAADTAGIVADFNTLLGKLKTAGLMTDDA